MTDDARSWLARIGVRLPIVQAPMAGVSTPTMAAAVSNAGALGSVAVGHLGAEAARDEIAATRAATARPVAVNVFCHAPLTETAAASASDSNAWLQVLAPQFARFGAETPRQLRAIYTSFVNDDAMLEVLLAERPAVVSVHFGLPPRERIAALRNAGIAVVATATSVAEAHAARDAGVSALVAQGYEAGGHRGVFEPHADTRMGTLALVRLLVRATPLPVIAAGGIMDGAGIAAALALGACAAQLGTAFIDCPESAADAAYRAALRSDASARTTVTDAISGRPARALENAFTRFAVTPEARAATPPAYPLAYDAGKALHAAAKARGEFGYGAQWAGQGAPLSRALPAAALVATLVAELHAAVASLFALAAPERAT